MKQIANSKKLLSFRRELRHNQTEAERLFWNRVRGGRFFGLKFKRQYSLDPYILDFYCRERKLAIELDGSQHIEDVDYDNKRTLFLNSLNITVLRFWNNDVMRDLNLILEAIRIKLEIE